MLGLGIVPTQRGINGGLLLVINGGWADKVSLIGRGIVAERIRVEREIRVNQADIIAKNSTVIVRGILSSFGCEGIQTITNSASREIVCYILGTVIVQAIGSENHPLVYQAYAATKAGNLGIAIVVQNIAIAFKAVTLNEAHMPKGVQRVVFLEEVSRIAIHQCRIMAKTHISLQYLGIRHTLLVEREGS